MLDYKEIDYAAIGGSIGNLVGEKQKSYGNAVQTSAEALKLLYPAGIAPRQYDDMLMIARIWDKLSRLANDKNAFLENPYADIAGYAIRGAAKDGYRVINNDAQAVGSK